MTIFLGLQENKVGKCTKSIHICPLRMLTGFSAESERNLWFGNLLNLKLNTRLPTKMVRELDVDAVREEGQGFKSQIHLSVISRDC